MLTFHLHEDILKELVGNALDAAEEAGTAPVIKINASNGIITVDDNGPGIPAEKVTSIPDYGTRTSSRAAYVAPTRGAQGNALREPRTYRPCHKPAGAGAIVAMQPIHPKEQDVGFASAAGRLALAGGARLSIRI